MHFYQHGLYDIFVNDSIINISRNPKKYNIKDNREGILQIQSLVFGINNQQQNVKNSGPGLQNTQQPGRAMKKSGLEC